MLGGATGYHAKRFENLAAAEYITFLSTTEQLRFCRRLLARALAMTRQNANGTSEDER
jgi:hypothetical protein